MKHRSACWLILMQMESYKKALQSKITVSYPNFPFHYLHKSQHGTTSVLRLNAPSFMGKLQNSIVRTFISEIENRVLHSI